jgi:glycerate 2-kinase
MMPDVQILVASDRIGALSSSRAGEVIASGWPAASSRVVPVGEAGRGFVQAYADACGVETDTVADESGVVTLAAADEGAAMSWEPATAPTEPIPYAASSWAWGEALRDVLARRPPVVYVDLVGPVVHDAGAGALAALGASADVSLDDGVVPLSGLSRLELAPVRALLAHTELARTELIGVVPEAELSARLLGLRGITARRGREINEDPATMLRIDAALERFATVAGGAEIAGAPGAGACGGLGFLVLALGGRLVTGPSVTLNTLPRRLRPDLVLTGCGVFDFAHRGGGVVAEVARLASGVLAPCVVLAGEVYVGAREMRALGIEAAYAVRPESGPAPAGAPVDASPGEDDLATLARRVARTWSW